MSKEKENLSRIERAKRGAGWAAVWGLSSATAAALLYLGNNPEAAREYIKNPEFLKTVGEMITLHTVLWSIVGAVVDGYIEPELNNLFDNLKNKLH